MTPVKRIECIIDAAHTPTLLEAVRRAGVPHYSLIREVQGDGDRGKRSGDELTDIFRNCYILIACPEAKVDAVTSAVRPLLKAYGGICLVSDALWLEH
ncbi:MAG: hypothetical protein KDA28_02710 [Phycisphaerales bacterium]|nr:hypothetical protein [Phycisphaerales bacterium]